MPYKYFEPEELVLVVDALTAYSGEVQTAEESSAKALATRLAALDEWVSDEERDAYIAAAKQRYQEVGVLEFDDNAIVSAGGDPGAYVMGWQWISSDEAGLPDPTVLEDSEDAEADASA